MGPEGFTDHRPAIQRYEALVAAVTAAINAADPIGLLKIGAPIDEYGSEVGTIVARVAKAEHIGDTRRIVHEEFGRRFGPAAAGRIDSYEVPARAIWAAVLEFRRAGSVELARAQAVAIASRVLDGGCSAVLAAIHLNRLRSSLEVSDDDPDFETFNLIDSECDALPFGAVRQHWAPEALAAKEEAVARAERWALETGREALRHVVTRFGGAA